MCPYFTTEILDLQGTHRIGLAATDSFLLVMAVKGCGMVTDSDGSVLPIQSGETILVAASSEWIELEGSLKVVTASVL